MKRARRKWGDLALVVVCVLLTLLGVYAYTVVLHILVRAIRCR